MKKKIYVKRCPSENKILKKFCENTATAAILVKKEKAIWEKIAVQRKNHFGNSNFVLCLNKNMMCTFKIFWQFVFIPLAPNLEIYIFTFLLITREFFTVKWWYFVFLWSYIGFMFNWKIVVYIILLPSSVTF